MVEDTEDPDSPNSKLYDIIRFGVAEDLYYLEEAIFLQDFISENATPINAATFGLFFGSLQVILTRYIILQTARIFEAQNKRYPIRSIKTALAILENHASRIEIKQRHGLITSLRRCGCGGADLARLNDRELTNYTAKHFSDLISDSHPNGTKNAKALFSIKTIRDKKIAHPESVSDEELPATTYDDIKTLIIYAKQFLGAVGFGYLSIAYEDDTGYQLLSSDAKHATLCLTRILKKADVFADKK